MSKIWEYIANYKSKENLKQENWENRKDKYNVGKAPASDFSTNIEKLCLSNAMALTPSKVVLQKHWTSGVGLTARDRYPAGKKRCFSVHLTFITLN